MNTRSFIFFTRILAQAQISSLIFRGLFIEVLSVTILETTKTDLRINSFRIKVLSVTILETTKTYSARHSIQQSFIGHNFGDYKNLKWYQLMTP